VIVVEKDRRFLPVLEMTSDYFKGKLKIIHGDVLQLDNEKVLQIAEDFSREKGLSLQPSSSLSNSTSGPGNLASLKLIGNLPFSVATPLLIQWLRDTANKRNLFQVPKIDMSLMFQKEVALVGSFPFLHA